MSTLQQRISDYLREKPRYRGADVAEADPYEYLLQRADNTSRADQGPTAQIEQNTAGQASLKETE